MSLLHFFRCSSGRCSSASKKEPKATDYLELLNNIDVIPIVGALKPFQ